MVYMGPVVCGNEDADAMLDLVPVACCTICCVVTTDGISNVGMDLFCAAAAVPLTLPL